jgi:hypothetical protein
MNRRWTFLASAVLAVPCLCAANVASAGVVVYSSQSAFEAQGTFSQSSNFDDLATGTTIAVPYPRGGVTYTNVDYVIDGPGAYGGLLDSVRQTLFNARLDKITGDIDTSPTSYSLFGFKTGYVTLDAVPVENVMLTTNLGSYLMSGLTVPKAGTSLGFVGFATTMPGEYFTGFALATSPSSPTAPNAPVMTDVELGTVTPVPEPTTLALLALGFVGAIGWRRFARWPIRAGGPHRYGPRRWPFPTAEFRPTTGDIAHRYSGE